MKKRYQISTFSLTMITSAFVIGIRNLPTLAETGMHVIFFTLLAALGFLLPVGLVCAELATGWPKLGGVYIWVKEAFGEKWGFVSIYLQWIQNVVWFPAALAFFASTFAYSFFPSWANDPFYLLIVILVVYWGTTLLNLRGMKVSSWISSSCVMFGVFLPAAIITLLGLIYYLRGHPVQVTTFDRFSEYFPSLADLGNLTILLGFVFSFMGSEASAVHAQNVRNPKREYPIAIFFMIALAVVFSILGSLSISIVVSQSDISLVAGVMEALEIFLKQFNLRWLVPIMSLLISFGVLGQISTWIVGPSRGLLVTARYGNIPPYFQKVKRGMPSRILYFQAIIVTILALLFFFMPNVNAAYWILITMTALLYMFMYLIVFAAAVRLRYTRPQVKRGFTIPGGKIGMWIVAGYGSLFCLFTMFVGFFAPSQLIIRSIFVYELLLVSGLGILLSIPFIIYRSRKKHWKQSITSDKNN